MATEVGLKPLKAIHLIVHGENETAQPGQLFIPSTAEERQDLLRGAYPAAKEPTDAELAAGVPLSRKEPVWGLLGTRLR